MQLSAKFIKPPSNQRGHGSPRETSRTRVYGRVKRRPRSRTTASQYQSGSATLRRCSSASVPIPRDLMKRASRVLSAYSRVGLQTTSLLPVSVMHDLPPRQCTTAREASGLRKLERARNDPGQVRDDSEEGDLHDAEVDRHDLVEGLEARRRKRDARRLAALGEQLVQQRHVEEQRAVSDDKPDDDGQDAKACPGEDREAPPGERPNGFRPERRRAPPSGN